jgi:hypothetical protein
MHVQSDSERRIDRAVAEYRFRSRLSGNPAAALWVWPVLVADARGRGGAARVSGRDGAEAVLVEL